MDWDKTGMFMRDSLVKWVNPDEGFPAKKPGMKI
jgi:hypothetical protein